MDHSMRDDAVALGLVMQNVMCRNIWQQCVWASIIFFFSALATVVHSISNYVFLVT